MSENTPQNLGKEAIGEENTAKLLARAYRPELPEEDFVRRTKEAMRGVRVAEGSHRIGGAAWARWWLAAAVLAAGAGFYWAVGLSREGVYQQEGGAVVIGGVRYVPESNTRPPVPVGEGTGVRVPETVMAATNGVGATTGTAVVDGGGTKAGGVTSAPIVVASGEGATTRVPLVVTSGVGATTSAPLAVADSGGKITARAAGSRPATEVVTEGQTITTAAGQRRRVGLADGTVVYINEKTALHIDGARQVRLDSGVAYFEVARRQGAARVQDPTFLVKTPTRQVAALGTHFAVDVKEAGTGIVVTQGRVDVEGMEVYAGEELPAAKDAPKVQAPRVSVALDWIRDLVAAAQSPLVPASDYCGGALVVVDPSGQESRLTLRNYAVDVYIEDGFARTTIDQTYFNDSTARMEGTFYFPLPADGSLSRLAMYVDGTLMEGGMCEREAAREVYETILYQRRDPALLEWVDGSTFKMRVFPIEGRQEKRVLLSYTQKLESLYGQMKYRFPAGHSMSVVRDWAFKATVKNAAGNWWSSESHPLNALEEGKDLVLTVTDRQVKPDRDVTLNLGRMAGGRLENQARFAAATYEGQQYLMVRAEPALSAVPRRQRRDWVFLFEASGARDPVVARAQIEIIKSLLDNAEHDDTFAIVTAGAQARVMGDPQAATPENVAKAVDYLAQTHLVGALDLGQALAAATPLVVAGGNPYLVHVGTGIAVLGERSADELVKRVPAGAKYVGVAVGKSWSRQFMKAAAGRTNGYFTQINPDESVAWRAFELLATLNTPRLLNVRVIDPSEKLTFLNFGEALAQGEEFCAIARYAVNSVAPSNLVLTGTLDGVAYRQELVVREVAENAGYLPRMWAKLEIDRLLAENSSGNKAAIIGLSKDMYVMSPYTSLLVLENEAMYAQYKVDRGRKDHWAMYAAPGKIPVVTEAGPLVMAQTRPAGQKLSAEGALGSVLVRVGSPVVTWPNVTVTNGTGGTMSVREYVARVNGNARGRLGMDFYGEVENSEFNTLEGLKLRPQMNSWENLWFKGAGNSNDLDLFSWGLMPQVTISGGGGLARTGPVTVSIGLLGGSDFGLGGAKTFAGSTVVNAGTFLRDASGQVVGLNITNPGVAYYKGTRAPMGGGFGGFGVGGASGVDGTALLGGKVSQLQLMPGLVENISGTRVISGPVTSFGGRTVGSGGMYYKELNLTGGILRTVTEKGRESGFNSLDFNGGYVSMNGGSLSFTNGGLLTLNGIASRGVSMNGYSTGGFAGGGGVPQYQRPTYSNDWRVFGDLLAYAPGMNTSLADVRAVLESETDVDPAMAAGTIEPAARALIERARRTGWQSVTISQGPGQGALTIRVDGQGRYHYERRVSEGLRETVVCDGTTLLQLYPDIGVGARRAVSRFHREELAALVPWVVPPAEDLARGCSVAVVTGRTVQITPKGAAERNDAEGKALAYVVLQMIFGESGRLVERRWVEMPTNKVVGFETYSAAGEVRTCDGAGKELGKADLAAKDAAGPVLSAETDSLVVLPLPIRGRDRVVLPADELARIGTLGWTSEWPAEKALALIAADVGSNPTEVQKVIAERFFARGDRRIGFYTLLMASGMNMNEETMLFVGGGTQVRFNPLVDHPGSDLARYCVDLWHARQEGVHADILFKGDGKGDFVARMAAIRVSIVRMLAGGIEGERANAVGLLAACKDPTLAWALYAMATHYGGGTDYYHALAEAAKSVSEAPALGYAARFEEAWGLYGTNTAGNMEAARGKFVELYKETVDAGMLPAINAEFMSAVRYGNGETWQKVLRETSGRVREKQGRVAAMAQAWQCWQMGDQGMANELFEKALAEVPAEERLAATVAGVNYLCNAGQYLRALKMVEPLLEDGRLNGSPGIWRVAAALAFNQRMLAQGLKYQERAMDLEFANMPAVVNVQGLRQEYSQALGQYQQMASAMALLGQAPSAELITRVIRTADRWRAIDPEKAGACQAAARVFAALNVPELAWEYLTTPLAEKFNEAAPWAGLAQQLQQQGDMARADMAYATAFEVEPTNAQMLWDRATVLQQMSRMAEARDLMRKLAEGKWEARFAGLQSQAKSYLQTQ